jgi:hypothetical protein
MQISAMQSSNDGSLRAIDIVWIVGDLWSETGNAFFVDFLSI